MEEKNLTPEQIKEKAMENIEKMAKETATEVANEVLKGITEKMEGLSTKAEIEKAFEDAKKELDKKHQEFIAEQKKQSQIKSAVRNPNSSIKGLEAQIKAAIEANEALIKEASARDVSLIIKQEPTPGIVDASSFASGSYADLTTEVAPLYGSPYDVVNLRNIFPVINTTANSLSIPKRLAPVGKAAVWKRSSGTAKPQIELKYTKETVSVDWIPAFTTVAREVLDDIGFMSSEIPYALVHGEAGILAAENKMIMDYIEHSDNHTDYTNSGADFDTKFEDILAASFGQLGDKRMRPTHILINNWDYLRYLAFTKAKGSGEYDKPIVDVKNINGILYINNIMAVAIPEIEAGAAYVIDANRSRFVSREGLQTYTSREHDKNLINNTVTFLAETRAGFFTYDANSIIKVALAAAE